MDAFSHLLGSPAESGRRYGVVIGVVTNNRDPDGLGRVKLKLPWLADDVETDWARVATPMAGAERGVYLLPEVDDEVLVAFEHGNPEYPYVLGALWNAKDKPPESNPDGKNNVRAIRSRSGHVIRLTDTDGEEKIEVIAKGAKSTIVIDAAANTITVTAGADLTIQAGDGKLQLSGNGVEITSDAGVTIKGNQNVDVEAGARMKLKGQIVNIN